MSVPGPAVHLFLFFFPQPASSRDFYLDTLFSPVWMSGPHVFSFAKDGTVVCPKTYHTEPYPGCRASAGAASSSGRRIYDGALYSPSHSHSSSSSSSSSWSFPSTPNSKISGRANKEWKNIAISEQDDAEFVAREAEAEVRARAEAKGKLVGLVYTWPPKLLPGPCAGCEVLAVPRRRAEVEGGEGARLSVDTGIQETSVPASSYGSSRQSASESKVFLVPKRRAVAHREEVLLEKSVEFGVSTSLFLDRRCKRPFLTARCRR